MSKCISFILSFFFIYSNSIAQKNEPLLTVSNKLLIDSSAYHKWRTVNGAVSSHNGRYFSYVIDNLPIGSNTGVIKDLNSTWEIKTEGVKYTGFSANSRLAIVHKSNDSLFVVDLNKTIVGRFSSVIMSQFIKSDKRECLSIYRNNGQQNELLLYDCESGEMTSFRAISNFALSQNRNVIAMLKDSVEEEHIQQILYWYNVNEQNIIKIWEGTGFSGSLTVDGRGSQAAFLITDTLRGEVYSSCLYYKKGEKKCRLLFNNETVGIRNIGRVSDLFRFSSDGLRLFFHVTIPKYDPPAIKPYDVNLNIWSYRDKKLQSLQLKDNSNFPRHPLLYVCEIDHPGVMGLEQDGELVLSHVKKDKILILHSDPDADYNESGWNSDGWGKNVIVSGSNGERITLERIGERSIGYLSPDEKYVIYTDNKDFYSYDIATGEYRNLTRGIKTNWQRYRSRAKEGMARGIAAWIKNDDAVLIYDRYDIWLLDPKGAKRPVNVTNGYGAKHQVVFSLGLKDYESGPISWSDKLILNGIDLNTKNDGFFQKNLKRTGNPEVLTLGPYSYSMLGNHYPQGFSSSDKGKVENYIVSRMSATESPNFFRTADFRTFTPVSEIYPERDYNWYTSELHTWKSIDGQLLQGILYKPENFDSTKKYPLIFNYYERKSDNLNVYFPPDYSSADIDIPTYVSNGYLVFTPDIEYPYGDPMQGTYNSVISAAHYLSKLSFVDSTKMGIQGFSFGGIQTNFLIANSSMFAAACAGSGLTDMISAYGTVSLSGASLQGSFHNGGQYRMGTTPWDSPGSYIKNSPIFKVNKITSPLLMMHTTNDEACPFPQALELFTALRRLGKRVWLLEYTDGRHSIDGKSAIDFDIRMRQFFDHYLKGKPAPRWMIEGIPASKKGREDGLELDTIIKEGEPYDIGR